MYPQSAIFLLPINVTFTLNPMFPMPMFRRLKGANSYEGHRSCPSSWERLVMSLKVHLFDPIVMAQLYYRSQILVLSKFHPSSSWAANGIKFFIPLGFWFENLCPDRLFIITAHAVVADHALRLINSISTRERPVSNCWHHWWRSFSSRSAQASGRSSHTLVPRFALTVSACSALPQNTTILSLSFSIPSRVSSLLLSSFLSLHA